MVARYVCAGQSDVSNSWWASLWINKCLLFPSWHRRQISLMMSGRLSAPEQQQHVNNAQGWHVKFSDSSFLRRCLVILQLDNPHSVIIIKTMVTLTNWMGVQLNGAIYHSIMPSWIQRLGYRPNMYNISDSTPSLGAPGRAIANTLWGKFLCQSLVNVKRNCCWCILKYIYSPQQKQ